MTENGMKKGSLKSNHYFIYMVIVLMFVEILDTYSTTFPTAIPSKVIEEFLLPHHTLNVAQSIMAACISIATIGTYFVFLNQYLADKVGRKKILAFTVFGMGFSALLLFFSSSIIDYTIYLFMLFVFFSSDIWTIYINEEAPQDKRALWTNIVLMGGLVGAVLLIVFRAIFISETTTYWRGMTFPAIFIGIIMSIVILFTLKETSKFKEMKKNKGEKQQSTRTIIQNMKALFSGSNRKGFIAILIAGFIVTFNQVFNSMLEEFLFRSPYFTDDDATMILTIISAAVFIGYILTGIIADKKGRKVLFYVYAILQPISVIFVVIGANSPIGAIVIVALSAGVAYISGQSLSVLIRIVSLELVPTEIRGLGTGVKSLIAAFGMTLGLLFSSMTIYSLPFGELNLGITFILFSLPYLLIVPLIYFFLKETKDVDLSNVE